MTSTDDGSTVDGFTADCSTGVTTSTDEGSTVDGSAADCSTGAVRSTAAVDGCVASTTPEPNEGLHYLHLPN